MNDDITTYAATLARTAKTLSRRIGATPTTTRNAILRRFTEQLDSRRDTLIAANEQDLQAATQLSSAMRERLNFGQIPITATIASIQQIIAQSDPIGAIRDWQTMPSGIQVGKMRVPLGVILMIYESRPNVTADAAALAIKSGNAIILRGGRESQQTNMAIAACLNQALTEHDMAQATQVVSNPDRLVVGALLADADNIDIVIPRGGRALVERVIGEATMPVIKHLEGNCHVYVDAQSDIDMAVTIIHNAKTRRYGVCNAAESVLLHTDIATTALPSLAKALQMNQVELRVCPESQQILLDAGIKNHIAASHDDWSAEYLAPIISIKIVVSLTDAIDHINQYGSGHTDAIVTTDIATAWRFLREVDSSSVLINASTSFADGGEYGLGAEIGISTDKLHVRGPVGLSGLTTEKYVVLGSGHCRP